jgi:hypothetical protein
MVFITSIISSCVGEKTKSKTQVDRFSRDPISLGIYFVLGRNDNQPPDFFKVADTESSG